MRYWYRWMVAAAFAALIFPQVAFAKSPAAHITIDGDELALPAVDGQRLLMSPWAGDFLGAAVDSRPAGVAGVEPHEVRFWWDKDGDGETELMYAFDFYPAGDGSSAYVRLPERDEDLWAVNQSTIARKPGSWYLASPAWTAVIAGHDAESGSADIAGRLLVTMPALALGAVATFAVGYTARRKVASSR